MLKRRNVKISIIGLGYIGMPLAVEFSKKFNVVGFDLDKLRISELNDHYDRTGELSSNVLLDLANLIITSDEKLIKDSNIYIVTVPTPTDGDHNPDLNPLLSASKTIGKYLNVGDIVIYESTVFPGCTEEICVPVLEKASKLKFNKDFFCGYSPERINPGDKKNTLTKITKVVSASDNKTLDIIENLYASIISAGTIKASSIKIAEAAKVIENTQRDVNIALVNELALIFEKLNIDTGEVLKVASTKWNFNPFTPGLVGGHCIGVDPYYLTHKAIEVGYRPKIILAGREINDSMGYFIADKTISILKKHDFSAYKSNIAILGLSFKENCPDIRNTKVVDIINRLETYNCKITINDDCVDAYEAKNHYGLDMQTIDSIKNQDAVIIAVSHKEYSSLPKKVWKTLLVDGGIVIDVKSFFKKEFFSKMGFNYWSL